MRLLSVDFKKVIGKLYVANDIIDPYTLLMNYLYINFTTQFADFKFIS